MDRPCNDAMNKHTSMSLHTLELVGDGYIVE